MKILHITAAHLNGNNGIPAVLKALSTEQNKIEGVEARVLSLCEPVDQMESIYFDYIGNKDLKNYLGSFLPDIAIFHSFYHFEFAKAAYILKSFKIPFVIEPHGSFGHQALMKSRWKKYFADKTIFRSLIKDSIGYIFTNRAEMNDSAYPKNRKCVIPNGVYRDVVTTCVKNLSIKKPVFYFLGRYDINHKGLDFLMAALKILDEKGEQVIVRLFGTGTEEQIAFIHNNIDNYKNIKVTDGGTIYGEAKIEALQKVNILLLTSRYEGSPMTILDALSYGNPCLVTPGTNVADEIVDNHLGWKVELDAESIAEGILRAEKEYIADATGYYERSKQHVLSNYIWGNIAQQSIKEYKLLIG